MMITLPIQLPKVQLCQFCDRRKIKELALFGSVLRNDFRPNSDINVLVSFSSNAEWGLFEHVKMQQELESILERQVDLVSKRAIERSQNWIRRREILETAQVIYAKE